MAVMPPRPDVLPRMPKPPAPPRPRIPTSGVGRIPRSATTGASTGVVGGIGSAVKQITPTVPVPTGVPSAVKSTVVNDSTSYGQQARIDAINERIKALGDSYNDQRLIAAVNAKNSLMDNGWFDAVTQIASGDGSLRYDLNGFGEGQNQRDQVMGSNGNFNARGALFSSAANRARRAIIQRIQTQRQRMLEAAAYAQSQSIQDQIAKDAALQADLASASGDYEDWKAAQGGRA